MSEIEILVNQQKDFFNTNITKSLSFRKRQLLALKNAIKKHENSIYDALWHDLHKAKFETYETEIGIVLAEISYMLKHLDSLAKVQVHKPALSLFPAKAFTVKEPFGVVLIISPWNYPFQLALTPLVGAIAAGNCAIVKPSNYAGATSQVIEDILKDVFPAKFVAPVQGGREVNQDLLKQDFDYIFFTGSVKVGKVVMQEAANHLTPVTLELGGKSPCLVDYTTNIDQAGKRIAWGKFLNAGQTCVAPDYVLVHSSVKEELISAILRYIKDFYGETPLDSLDYPHIISKKHYERLLTLLDNETIIGGEHQEENLALAPTLLPNASFESLAMKEEIFGPILPIIEYEDLDLVLKQIKKLPKPLALYLFTSAKDIKRKVLKNLSFGGGCINDTIMHFVNESTPFGGVGNSGMGHYHGAYSFNTFSHTKSVIERGLSPDIPLRYPPFKENLSLLKKILK